MRGLQACLTSSERLLNQEAEMKTKAWRFALALSLALLGLPFCANAQTPKPAEKDARPRAATPQEKAKVQPKPQPTTSVSRPPSGPTSGSGGVTKSGQPTNAPSGSQPSSPPGRSSSGGGGSGTDMGGGGRSQPGSQSGPPPKGGGGGADMGGGGKSQSGSQPTISMPPPSGSQSGPPPKGGGGGADMGGGGKSQSGSQPTISVPPPSGSQSGLPPQGGGGGTDMGGGGKSQSGSQPTISVPPPSGSGGLTKSGQPAKANVNSPTPHMLGVGPAIASLDVNQGQPGGQVRISGKGFGNAGKVHFVVNPGKDMTARMDGGWDDAKVTAYVPDVEGVLGYRGYVYIVSGGQISNQVPFQFNPKIEYKLLPITSANVAWGFPDCKLVASFPGPAMVEQAGIALSPIPVPFCGIDSKGEAFLSVFGGIASGGEGDDRFFQGYQLHKGWVVDRVNFFKGPATNGDCGVVAKYEGTLSPYVDVHCWVNPKGVSAVRSNTSYRLSITIRGPAGVPYQ